MSSKRRKGRSRSPPHSRLDRSPSLGNLGRSSVHRQYRERDDYDDYGYDQYRPPRDDADNRRQEDERVQVDHFNGQNPNVTYDTDNNYGTAPRGNHSGRRDHRNRSDDCGPSPHSRRRDSSQAGQSRRGYMPPPSSRPPHGPRQSSHRYQSSHTEQKRPSRDSEPKRIPDVLRDKCGACKEGHDIRFCPYPNTEDGRTKICPICDTSKHAWYTCEHYDDKGTGLQWNVCWTNRRGLPVIVHDASLNELFSKKVHLGDVKKPLEDRVRALNMEAGPLSPAFVKRLMPPQYDDDCVQQQLGEGRLLPWELEKEILESNMDRPSKVIEDPETKDMQLDKLINGTKTTYIPKAGKLKYFRELHQKNRKDEQTAQQNSDVYKSMESLDLRSSFPKRPPRILASRRLPEGKWASNSEEKITCANCGAEGHRFQNCPSKCLECGGDVRSHMAPQCKRGCLCRDSPGHSRAQCDLPCRLCLAEDKNSITAIKDCRRHCQYHLCEIKDALSHARCVDFHHHCPKCRGRHWHQDCPALLKTICPVQSCRAFKCELHCKSCGGPTAQQLLSLCPAEWWIDKESLEMWITRFSDLVSRWHVHLALNQWIRQEVNGGDIGKDAWSKLRCKTHNNHVVDADSLEKLRETAWRLAISHMRQDHEGGLDKAAGVLAVPECHHCFASAYRGVLVGDFEDRKTGVVTEWGDRFLAAFPPADEDLP